MVHDSDEMSVSLVEETGNLLRWNSTGKIGRIWRHRAETHRYFNVRFFGQMPPDASDFHGGIPALGVVSARASLLLSAKTDCSGVRDKGCDWCWQFRIFEFSDWLID